MQGANGRRALIVVENSYGPRDTRVWSEAQTLREGGWEVVVVCPAFQDGSGGTGHDGAWPRPEEIEGVTVHTFPLTPAERGIRGYVAEYATALWRVAACVRKVWRERPFSVIQFCNPPDIFFPIALAYKARGASAVFDHHDLFPEVVRGRFGGLVGTVLYRLAALAERLTFRSTDVVLSTNASYRAIAISRGMVPTERVFVVRNGPRAEMLAPTDPVPSLKRGFRYMACYVGLMSQQDGVLEMADMVRHVVRERGRQDILFALLGDGAVRQETLDRIHDWDLDGYVIAPGMVRDRLLLRQYICTSDVCLSPETSSALNDRSTFIKVGEYMAMGKPILAYELPETRYTAQGAAYYVNSGTPEAYADALLDLLADPARREEMGRQGRERMLRELAWEHQKPSLLEAYQLALARSRASRRRYSAA